MDINEVYKYVKETMAAELTELQQAIMVYEAERYREEIAGSLRHEVQDWMDAVCQQFNISIEHLMTKSRKRDLVTPRQVIMWGLITGVVPNKLSFTAIGGLFHRDHATALHARKAIKQLLDTDQHLREDVILLVNQFGWRAGYDKSTKSFYMVHSVYVTKSAA